MTFAPCLAGIVLLALSTSIILIYSFIAEFYEQKNRIYTKEQLIGCFFIMHFILKRGVSMREIRARPETVSNSETYNKRREKTWEKSN